MIWLVVVGVGQAQECPEMDIDQQAERAVVALTDADFKLAGRLAEDGLSALLFRLLIKCAPIFSSFLFF